jgi:hypothetical protein
MCRIAQPSNWGGKSWAGPPGISRPSCRARSLGQPRKDGETAMALWKRISAWLNTYKNALEGAVALVTLLGLLVYMVKWVVHRSQPDLVAQVEVDEHAIPNDLIMWANWAWFGRVQPSEPGHGGPAARSSLLELMYPHPSSGIEKRFSLPQNSGVLRISVFNQTDQAIPNVRVRTDGIAEMWDVEMGGSYLMNSEIQDYLSRVPYGPSTSALALPQLPPIPPGGSVNLALYGDVSGTARAELSVPNHTSQITRIVKLPDTRLLTYYREPYRLGPLLILTVLPVLVVLPFLAYAVRQRIVRRAVPGVLYNAACSEAVQERPDSAIVFLRKAFEAGYADKAHARADSDLESLHGREDFEALVGK